MSLTFRELVEACEGPTGQRQAIAPKLRAARVVKLYRPGNLRGRPFDASLWFKVQVRTAQAVDYFPDFFPANAEFAVQYCLAHGIEVDLT